MSDQAFVKAFSRRRLVSEQLSAKDAETGPRSERGASTDTPDEVNKEVGANGTDFGGLHLDQSVASTARVWVDPLAEQVARADYAENGIPRPHLEAASDCQPLTGFSAAEGHLRPNAGQEKTSEPDAGECIQNAYSSNFTDAASFVNDEISNVPPEDVLRGMRQPYHPSLDPGPDSDILDHDSESQLDFRAAQCANDQQQDVAASARITENPFASAGSSASPVPTTPAVGNEHPLIFSGNEAGDSVAPTGPLAHDTASGSLHSLEGTAGSQTNAIPFQAVWEVDVLDVPTTVADLFFEGTLFQQVAERISEAVQSGLNSVIVTSTKAGEGRTSVAVGLAMAAAATGIRVALVDANAEQPTLADDLRLELEYGWVDTIRAGLPIKEVAVHAVEDGVTLVPLMPPAGGNPATGYEVVQLIELLKDKFELVILDGPTAQSVQIHQCASAADSAIIVRDMTRTDTLAINEFSCRLREAGVQGVGVVENFT